MTEDMLGPRIADGGGAEGELLGRVSAPRPLTAGAMARIRDAVATRAAPRARRASRLQWWALASLSVAGVAGATTVVERLAVRVFHSAPAKNAVHARVSPVPLQPTAAVVEPPPRPSPALEASPAEAPAARPEPRHAADRPRPHGPAPMAEAVPPISSLAEESELLEGALRKLRRDHDGAGAIATLDRYRDRFPDGELAHEADRTRVEALLLIARSRQALDILDGMSFGASTRDVDLVLVRGELRAEAVRCGDAETDFAAVLARVKGGPDAERALFGRASCRSRRGDQAGARTDIEEYLRRFPSGKFATQARAALAK